MSETQIQEYIDTYMYFRDRDEIAEERVTKNSIILILKQGNRITLPKNVELHRFIVIGRRGLVAESKQA